MSADNLAIYSAAGGTAWTYVSSLMHLPWQATVAGISATGGIAIGQSIKNKHENRRRNRRKGDGKQ